MSKLAFLFPGQGSQSVGMLTDFLQHSETKNIAESLCAEADATLGEPLTKCIMDGPPEQLGLTVNTQPALVLAETIAFQTWQAMGGAMPSFMAGHSLGEYSALVAAGAMSFHEAIATVRVRAKAMQDAVPVGLGGMAAILNLSDDLVLQACATASQAGHLAEAVNWNAPGQVVIAGTQEGVRLACQEASALGAKRCLPLPVSAPFHSSLMRPAAEILHQQLNTINIQTPQCAVVNNVDVAIEHHPESIVDALVRQAYSPVRWVETILHLRDAGVTQFIECGPGKVLTGLVKRICDVPCVAIGDVESCMNALALQRAA